MAWKEGFAVLAYQECYQIKKAIGLCGWLVQIALLIAVSVAYSYALNNRL
jgi:hypothetical protein